ncbi:hypothetical protein BHM03_00025207 [Ensete ventricosum]|nr:hypothetical protein BHM03_00025207 [Ensete ventricosum]
MAAVATEEDGSDSNRKMATAAIGSWQRKQPRKMAAAITKEDGSDTNRRRWQQQLGKMMEMEIAATTEGLALANGDGDGKSKGWKNSEMERTLL